MATFLFDEIIFGPIKSRRLGNSLGMNILSQDFKLCNYDCVYCECGWSNKDIDNEFPSTESIYAKLEKKLQTIKTNNQEIDVITFAGNGEPTAHPYFSEIINNTIQLRDIYFPKLKIAVLTNATNLDKPKVTDALNKIEMPILKIDTINQFDYEKVNRPVNKINIKEIIDSLKSKINEPIIQTMFFKGWIDDYFFDNTKDESIENYLNALNSISPTLVMIYSIARDTPMKNLQNIELEQLENIGKKINDLGIKTLITP